MDMASTVVPANSMTLIGGAVYGEPADDFENDILGIYAVRHDAVHLDEDAFRLPEGTHALEDADFEIRGADTGGKGAEGAVRAGVAVAHDHGIARPDESLFRKKGMADAVRPDVEKILDSVAMSPFAHHLSLDGALGVLCRGDMVDDRLDLSRIKYPVLPSRYEVRDGGRRRNLVAQDDIEPEHLCSGKGLIGTMGIKNLFSYCLSHGWSFLLMVCLSLCHFFSWLLTLLFSILK